MKNIQLNTPQRLYQVNIVVSYTLSIIVLEFKMQTLCCLVLHHTVMQIIFHSVLLDNFSFHNKIQKSFSLYVT